MYSNDPVRRYDIPAIERLLGTVVEWRDAILDKMYPAQENGPSTSGGVTEIAGFSWPTSPGQTRAAGSVTRRRFVQPLYGDLRLTSFSRQSVPAFLSIKSLMASAYSALGNCSPLGTFMPSQKISSRLPSGSRK